MKLGVVIPAAIGLLLIVDVLFAGGKTPGAGLVANPAPPGPIQTAGATAHAWSFTADPMDDETPAPNDPAAYAELEGDAPPEPDQFETRDQPSGNPLPFEGRQAPLAQPQLSAAGPAVHYPDPALPER